MSEGHRRGWLLAAAVAVVAVAGLVLWARPSGSAGGTTAPTTGTPVRVDRRAPVLRSVSLLGGHGGTTIGPYDGVVTVVNFWASWCAPCRRESGELRGLWGAYRGHRVRFVGVDEGDRRGPALSFVAGHPFGYASTFDPDGTVGDAFTIVGLPTTFIVTPEGRIRYVVFGAIEPTALRAALDRVLAEAFTGPA